MIQSFIWESNYADKNIHFCKWKPSLVAMSSLINDVQEIAAPQLRY